MQGYRINVMKARKFVRFRVRRTIAKVLWDVAT